MKKLGVKPDLAFNTFDKEGKCYFTTDDMYNFFKSVSLYPSERNMNLLFERFDKDKDGVVGYEEFVTAIQPFSN